MCKNRFDIDLGDCMTATWDITETVPTSHICVCECVSECDGYYLIVV